MSAYCSCLSSIINIQINLQSKCMDLSPLSAQHFILWWDITRMSATKPRKNVWIGRAQRNRRNHRALYSGGALRCRLHTPLHFHLEEQNRKTLPVETGGISTGRRWLPLPLDSESVCQMHPLGCLGQRLCNFPLLYRYVLMVGSEVVLRVSCCLSKALSNFWKLYG